MCFLLFADVLATKIIIYDVLEKCKSFFENFFKDWYKLLRILEYDGQGSGVRSQDSGAYITSEC